MRRSKRYLEVKKKIEPRYYSLEEALDLLPKIATAKFTETVELHVRLGVNPKHADQQVRTAAVLPWGTGKRMRVLVFAKGEYAKKAEEAGADIVGGEEIIKKIQEGFLDFEAVVATPDMMREVTKLGKILGPRGLMPTPKVGTVTFDLAPLIKEIKKGRVQLKVDPYGIIHCPLGKVNLKKEGLKENLKAVILALNKARPPTLKGTYFRSMALSTSMGPSIKIAPKEIRSIIEESKI
jgi:large subunit ribosomal protein L1